MDRRRRRHDRPAQVAGRGSLRHLPRLRGRGRGDSLDGDSGRARHRRGRRDGRRLGCQTSPCRSTGRSSLVECTRGRGARQPDGNDLLDARRHAAHSRQSVLGDRPHEETLRRASVGRRRGPGARRRARRGGEAGPRGRYRHQSGDGTTWRGTSPRGCEGHDPLQRRRTRHWRLRYRAWG